VLVFCGDMQFPEKRFRSVLLFSLLPFD
jgi:hypothetical protein